MKRSKVLALALAAGIALMGAGYAAWNDTLTINNTANTGNFDVDITQPAADANPIQFYSNWYSTTQDTLNHDGGSVLVTDASAANSDPDTATVTLTNVYPGARIVVNIPVTNVGSVDAVLDTDAMNTANANAIPAWLTLSSESVPGSLVAGGTGTITLTLDVSSDDEIAQSTPTTFDYKVVYKQFNQ